MKSLYSKRQKIATKFKKELRERATPEELKMLKKLRHLFGKGVMFQKSFISGPKLYIVDFYIPKPYKLVIEVDGWHHYSGKQLDADKIRDRYLTEKRGFSLLRIKNCEVDEFYLKETVRSITGKIQIQNAKKSGI